MNIDQHMCYGVETNGVFKFKLPIIYGDWNCLNERFIAGSAFIIVSKVITSKFTHSDSSKVVEQPRQCSCNEAVKDTKPDEKPQTLCNKSYCEKKGPQPAQTDDITP
jgi:hypothetical protein